MADHSSHNAELFNRLLQGKLSPAELEELVQWLGANKPDAEATRLILQQLRQSDETAPEISPDVMAGLEARLPLVLAGRQRRRNRIASLLYARPMRYAAAIILIAGAGLYFLLNGGSASKDRPAAVAQTTHTKDIAPGKDGAVLTLVDGTQVVLDSLGNGHVTTQNGTKVVLRNGQLVYEAGHTASVVAGYNTMSTPKGRQFQLVLPDGSKVWLNAASSIRYPTVFSGQARTVQITGEAYFEVARNASMPFRVQVNDETEIEVLGTHFNINSYHNESSINTTLLEGSVRVRNHLGATVLKPGQQAQASKQETIRVLNDVDVEKVVAWKNGFFDFTDASLQEVMRQLERWYDIEVVYEKNVPELEFYGKMGKDLSLATVLSGLKKSNVHFRMEGRTLVVLP